MINKLKRYFKAQPAGLYPLIEKKLLNEDEINDFIVYIPVGSLTQVKAFMLDEGYWFAKRDKVTIRRNEFDEHIFKKECRTIRLIQTFTTPPTLDESVAYLFHNNPYLLKNIIERI